MTSSLVGRIRLNGAVSDQVLKEFKKFPAAMDRIEIFDNSIPNDPSPPCKAGAVIHRSEAVFGEESLPCVSVLRRKVFDYNNRDFQSYQLETLLDSIAANYLTERGGGIQLTVHKLGRSSIFSPELSGRDIASFCMSKETRDQKNLLALPYMHFFMSPLRNYAKLEKVEVAPNLSQIEGLSLPILGFKSGNCRIHVIEIDRKLRKLSCFLESTETVPEHVARAIANSLMRDTLCFNATMYSESFSANKFSGALAVNRRLVGAIDPNIFTKWQFPIYSEFIM